MWTRKNIKLLRLSGNIQAVSKKRKRIDVFIEQVTDSFVVGAIAGLSAYVAAGESATLKIFGIAFGLTFLFKLKEYRNIDMPQRSKEGES